MELVIADSEKHRLHKKSTIFMDTHSAGGPVFHNHNVKCYIYIINCISCLFLSACP